MRPFGPLCEEVLRRKRRPLTPAEVKDAILKKCPRRNSPTFYNQVYIALSRNGAFRRMADGRLPSSTRITELTTEVRKGVL